MNERVQQDSVKAAKHERLRPILARDEVRICGEDVVIDHGRESFSRLRQNFGEE